MKNQLEQSPDTFVHRHLSQLKILTRLLEHELGTAKGATLTMDRELSENLLDLLEIFIDDVDAKHGAKRDREAARRHRSTGPLGRYPGGGRD